MRAVGFWDGQVVQNGARLTGQQKRNILIFS